jgi:hypothetical protein
MKVIKGNFSEKNKTAGNKKQQQVHLKDESSNYSTMLLDLIGPFLGENPEQDELERMLMLAIIAWNMSVSKSLGVANSNVIFDSIMKQEGLHKEEIEIVKKIVNEKQKKYREDNRLIQDFELRDERGDGQNLLVTGSSINELMEEEDTDESFDDETIDELQFEQGMVNRSAISLKYKPAFLEWLKQNDDFYDPLESRDNTIYLIEEKDSGRDASRWLKKNFAQIMNNEFEDATFDEKKWPARTYKVFCNLFEIQFHGIVMDLEDVPVIKNEPF